MNVLDRLQETTQYLRSKSDLKPKIGIVLGSGLGAFVNHIQVKAQIPYGDIPYFATSSVEGHQGRLILGELHGVSLAVMQGRVHYYEGHSMEQVAYPIRTLAMLGIETLLLTNSAGGLNPNMRSGDLMIIEDHINMMGANPLMGPNIKNLGPRFPDMTEAYDRDFIKQLEDLLTEQKVRFSRGIYCAVSGPTYETPAEVRFLQKIGGDAVGMSTVPESIAANHLGLRVAAVSCITNPAAGIHKSKLTHEEVTEIANSVEKTFCDLLGGFIKKQVPTS